MAILPNQKKTNKKEGKKMDKKKTTTQAKEEKEVEVVEKKAERGVETLDLNKAQVESFWFPGKGAKKEVVDEYINEAAAVLIPIIISIIKSFIQMMPMQNIRYLIGLFLMLADGYQKEVKRKLISSLLEDQEILRYWKDLMILPYEPIGEDAKKHMDDFKSAIQEPLMSVIAAIKATTTEVSEEKEEKTREPKLTIINGDTIFGKVRLFFQAKDEDEEQTEEQTAEEIEEEAENARKRGEQIINPFKGIGRRLY